MGTLPKKNRSAPRWVADARPTLSVVVPLYNEREGISHLYETLTTVLEKMGTKWELVLVDDGSRDGSFAALETLAEHDPRVSAFQLSRNFGQEAALIAGLREARGMAVVVIDADLQDPPELIPEMMKKWREGYQVVYGERTQRLGEGIFKRLFASGFMRVLNWVSDLSIPRESGHFRLMDRQVVDALLSFKESPQFLRMAIGWSGFSQIGVPFVRQSRKTGVTKFHLGKLLHLALETLTSFSSRGPFWIFMLALSGVGAGLATLAGLLFAAWEYSLPVEPWVWIASVFFLWGNIQFLCLALLGQYLGQIHRETRGRPHYFIAKKTRRER